MKTISAIFRPYLIVAAATLSLAGCDVKDPIYNTAHPDYGTVTLTTDWRGLGEGLTAPTSYRVTAALAGATATGYSATLSGVVNPLDHLFEPGTYRFLVYNAAEHITLSGTTATVAAAQAPAGATGTFVHTAPGWLCTATPEVAIAKDADHALTAVMQQQVGQLTLIIEPTGGTVDQIERIEGYLMGVASTLDLSTGTVDAPSNLSLSFTPIAEGPNAGWWSATVRLLGLAGAQQRLNARIDFIGGNPTPIALDSDLTTALATFNANKHTPITLGGSVVETPTGAGFTATITDWAKINGGDVNAN